ncbi:hypothetical protein EN745_01960 [Mesorhizobium sp. M4A.F.Ca.ET.022.05.2.1]|uniref:hypothetical protein n=1 Tax=Mesorhizobium sp. M4A.F.Ca.ET.022.05.2.1 TaxID=2496653 RepID=UPI000FCA909D|nr:hypothetical protein [Mesorhizobium sp. M4A.F.Ca.ET.022.05.2.1]RVC83619.1 hypothetical protein EN745_01960 [Mesorhizobium sp. M4A.F.Ca.ET.022.05.2.1]
MSRTYTELHAERNTANSLCAPGIVPLKRYQVGTAKPRKKLAHRNGQRLLHRQVQPLSWPFLALAEVQIKLCGRGPFTKSCEIR